MEQLLFLDDWRVPIDCANYMWQRKVDCTIYHKEWIIVRSYGQFVNWIKNNGLPSLMSLDHDLCDVFELKEELPVEEWFDLDMNLEYNGVDCVKFIISYCKEHNLDMPTAIVHSVNPDGREEMELLLKTK